MKWNPFKRKPRKDLSEVPTAQREYKPAPDAPSDLAASARAALRTAPGPSPWGMNAIEPRVERAGEPLAWCHEGNLAWMDSEFAGITALATRSGDVLLLLDFHCYVKPLGSRLLVFTPRAKEGILVRVYAIDALHRIERPSVVARQMRKDKAPIVAGGTPIAEVVVPPFLAGDHDFTFPPGFEAIPEILLVADLSRNEWGPTPGYAIYSLRPDLGRVRVWPQDWFNQDSWDFGYVWLSTVAREPRTGRLTVDGVRIAPHILSTDGRQVQYRLI